MINANGAKAMRKESKKRLLLIRKIGEVLEKQCRSCEYRSQNVNATICAECEHGKELQEIGKQLSNLKKERLS